METEHMILRLAEEIVRTKSETITIDKRAARQILEKVKSLEMMFAELLRSVHARRSQV